MGENEQTGNKTHGPDSGHSESVLGAKHDQAPKRFGDNAGPIDSDSEKGAFAGDAVAEAKMEAEKFRNEFLYLRAEFDNYKKHVIKERSDLRKYGSERLIADLLGVLDIFETALASEMNSESLPVFRKGVEMTASELKNTLQRHGVSEITSKGLPFDPAVNEAISSEESSDLDPGAVSKVFKKAYRLHDRVVRPGQVVVAKAKS